jgi:SP family myo-inositol transporter-like MFS transporter 13
MPELMYQARILLVRSDLAAVRQIMAKIYPLASPDDIDSKVHVMSVAVKHSVMISESMSWSERARSLFSVGMNRRALGMFRRFRTMSWSCKDNLIAVIGCGLQAGQQLCGFNTLMYYSASIFAALGFKNPTAVGCLVALVNFAFTILALKVSLGGHVECIC